MKEKKLKNTFNGKKQKEKKVMNLAIFITVAALETRRSESANYKSNGNG